MFKQTRGCRIAAILLLAIGSLSFANATGRPLGVVLPGPHDFLESGVAAYSGMGTWVDVPSAEAWEDPEETVALMAKKGVETLFLQTSNYRHGRAIVYRSAAKEILHEAHAAGIKVVGWYHPSLNRLNQDFRRVRAGIDLRGPEGERFDSFALDIESTTVSDIKERSQRMLLLLNQIRNYVGTDYALGAIVPDPGHSTYWPSFPYKRVDDFFDVFLPMSYFTWRTAGYENVRKYIGLNIRLVREGTGDKDVPIHVIGGLAGAASRREVHALVKTARERHIAGVSLYDFSITEDEEWKVMNKARAGP